MANLPKGLVGCLSPGLLNGSPGCSPNCQRSTHRQRRRLNPIRARHRETGAVGHFCEKISPGCAHCYAAAWNLRRRPTKGIVLGTGLDFLPVNRDKVEIFLDDAKLLEVLRRKTPTRIFWCDMTDLFGKWVDEAWIERCFQVMAATPQHLHQVLTKRSNRMRHFAARQPWFGQRIRLGAGERLLADVVCSYTILPNVCLGCSIENQETAEERVLDLLNTPAKVRFLSYEPALGPVNLRRVRCGHDHAHVDALTGTYYVRNEAIAGPPAGCGPIDWVICGGESGSKARPFDLGWARSMRDQCAAVGVPFFMKQVGSAPFVDCSPEPAASIAREHGVGPLVAEFLALKHRKGGDPEEWPEDLRVREMP